MVVKAADDRQDASGIGDLPAELAVTGGQPGSREGQPHGSAPLAPLGFRERHQQRELAAGEAQTRSPRVPGSGSPPRH